MKIPSHNIVIGNATDIGKVREHNEDYMAHFATPMGYCVIVCDGMGGHKAGDVAAQNTVEAIKHFLQNGKVTLIDPAVSLQNAIEFANFQLREMVQKDPDLNGMGTTCALVLIKNGEMFVAHAGDSRIYLIRDDKIKQITRDHSTVQNLIEVGVLTEDEAEKSDKKNQITKAVGIFEKVEPSVTEEAVPLFQNDKILICSDGLTGHLKAQEILETVNAGIDVQLAVQQLVDQANKNGGTDNITVQLIKYTGESYHKLKPKKRRSKKNIIILIVIIFIISAGFFSYQNIFKAKITNSEAIKKDTGDHIKNLKPVKPK